MIWVTLHLHCNSTLLERISSVLIRTLPYVTHGYDTNLMLWMLHIVKYVQNMIWSYYCILNIHCMIPCLQCWSRLAHRILTRAEVCESMNKENKSYNNRRIWARVQFLNSLRERERERDIIDDMKSWRLEEKADLILPLRTLNCWIVFSNSQKWLK